MNIAVIGGGASGLTAALAAKNENNTVRIYEREKRVGKKILATGNGRCNITNLNADICYYHGKDTSFMSGSIKKFWIRETFDFFLEMGLLLKSEPDGKVFPYSYNASSVVDALRRKTEHDGVETVCDFDVKKITKRLNGFCIENSKGEKNYCDRVIIACGGKASPALGSNGSGYDLLKSLGHKITNLSPSLVQIKTETGLVKKLKGIKINAKLSIGDKSEIGEILFTEYGISGPPVFSLSSYLGKNKYAEIDLMPEYEIEKVEEILYDRYAYLYDYTLEEYLNGLLNKKIGMAFLKELGIAPLSKSIGTMTEEDIKKCAAMIKSCKLLIEGTMSWNNAQVTKGGALTSEFDPVTMQSKLVEGLYACGEVLDIDGDCGGFNLQWAWSSGYVAGENAARTILKKTNRRNKKK